MKVVLLDTDVFSYIFKGSTQAREYQRLLRDKRLALSFMTVAELFQWAYVRCWGERRIQVLEQEIQSHLVLESDAEVCRQWALIRTDMRSRGRPISPQDAWNAAVAIRYSIPLVTSNVKDFNTITNLQLLTAE